MKRSAILAGTAMLAVVSGCKDDADQPAPAIGLSSFTRAAADTTAFGCQARSTRLPWGTLEARTWTPRLASQPANPARSLAQAYGPPFSARLIQAYADDFGEERRTVILELEDGCRRQFRADFPVGCRQRGNLRRDGAPSLCARPATYRIQYSSPLTSPELVRSGELRLLETQHFAIWYGNGNDNRYDFHRTVTAQGRTKAEALRDIADQIERQWLINRDVIGAPMPFADSADKQKLNIFICGTGRPNAGGDFNECGASAGEFMGISGWGLGKGSMVLAHEFGHMIEFFTGGFRGRAEAGPIWETGAEWTAFAVSPHFNASRYYMDNLENGPLFSMSRYEAYPFMNYLYENDRTRALTWNAWRTSVQAGAWSNLTKDFVETLVPLGQKTGAYPQGYVSFADDMGWYGARLVTMDFFNQRNMRDGLRPTPTTNSLAHLYTPLAGGGQASVYASPRERPLLQWGTHLVPLTAGGTTVKVTLTGRTTATSAAWRFSIVAVKDGDVPVYSALGKAAGTASGSTSLAVPSGTKLYLAVTATPYRYELLGWQKNDDPPKGTQFPYSVKIEGAIPRTGPVQACDPEMEPGTWSMNYRLNGNTDEPKPCS